MFNDLEASERYQFPKICMYVYTAKFIMFKGCVASI